MSELLIDLPPLTEQHPINAILGSPVPKAIARGVYQSGLSLDHDLKASGYRIDTSPFHEAAWRPVWDVEPGTDERRAALDAAYAAPHDYGVCDNWEQITERWPEILTSERRFVIGMTEIRRADQPERGGWRWHKWGEYVGTHEPQHEYLADEEGIESVWVFQIIEVLDDLDADPQEPAA